MSIDFTPGLIIGFILGVLYAALVCTDYVYDFSIETAQKACAPYGGIHRIESRIFDHDERVSTVVQCMDGTKVRRSNKR